MMESFMQSQQPPKPHKVFDLKKLKNDFPLLRRVEQFIEASENDDGNWGWKSQKFLDRVL